MLGVRRKLLYCFPENVPEQFLCTSPIGGQNRDHVATFN